MECVYLFSNYHTTIEFIRYVVQRITNISVKEKALFLIFCLFMVNMSYAQSISQKMSKALVNAGYENVRISQTHNRMFISLEDNVYTWNISGIANVIDTLLKYSRNIPSSLVILDNGIPQFRIDIEKQHVNSVKNLSVSYNVKESWQVLKHITPLNPPENKIDVVAYPQFTLQNTLLTQIYEIQLNLAPAIEISLWQGMMFTGQVIFPLKNDLGYEGDFIRPGFVTLAQKFRVPHAWFGRVTIGNFNAGRYGADICIEHPFVNNCLSVGFNAGLTGSSHFYDGQWVTGDINTNTWFAKAGYFYPKFNLQFDLSFGCYLNNDYGFRVDCTRHFGATTVGFYAMYTGGTDNGGFHFSTPLPPINKRNRRRKLRLVPARYFDWEYNAGTEFYYGRYYETRPNENRTEQWNNLIFIKNELLKTNK